MKGYDLVRGFRRLWRVNGFRKLFRTKEVLGWTRTWCCEEIDRKLSLKWVWMPEANFRVSGKTFLAKRYDRRLSLVLSQPSSKQREFGNALKAISDSSCVQTLVKAVIVCQHGIYRWCCDGKAVFVEWSTRLHRDGCTMDYVSSVCTFAVTQKLLVFVVCSASNIPSLLADMRIALLNYGLKG